MKKNKKPTTISDQDLRVLADFSQTESWKVIRNLRQKTIYNIIQKQFKHPTNDPTQLAIQQAWAQGVVYGLKSETTQIDSAIEVIEKRESSK